MRKAAANDIILRAVSKLKPPSCRFCFGLQPPGGCGPCRGTGLDNGEALLEFNRVVAALKEMARSPKGRKT